MLRLILISIFFVTCLSAHPTGDMILVNGTLYWSYVCPVNDPQHHACIMKWDEENGVRPWLTSSFSASDWTMSPNPDGSIYIIERYYDNARDVFMIRLFLLKNANDEPVEIKPWFIDENRFGEAGFAAIDDTTFVFVKYPNLYKLNDDGSAEIWKDWPEPLYGLRHIDAGRLLLRGESAIWLIDYNGNILESWSELLQPLTAEEPFGGNQIFDSDYSNGKLWLAYWGHRKFEFLEGENRTTIKQFESPFVPHAVAVDTQNAFVLASTIDPGTTQDILPNLWRFSNNTLQLIWGDKNNVTATEKDKSEIPPAFELEQNYPNPFNPVTSIKYKVANNKKVTLRIYDILGNEVASLVDNYQSAGEYEISFDGSDFSSGIYYYKLIAGNFSQTKKMLLLK